MGEAAIQVFFFIFVGTVAVLAFVAFQRAESFDESDFPETKTLGVVGAVELLEVSGPAGRRAAIEYEGDGVMLRVTFDRGQAIALARLLRSAAKN